MALKRENFSFRQIVVVKDHSVIESGGAIRCVGDTARYDTLKLGSTQRRERRRELEDELARLRTEIERKDVQLRALADDEALTRDIAVLQSRTQSLQEQSREAAASASHLEEGVLRAAEAEGRAL